MTGPELPGNISHAQLDWDEQGQPLSRTFGDVYFSRASGLEETRHVFLHHNQLAERFATLSPNAIFTIGETGFGSGLNFLAAWELWLHVAPTTARLHFISTEKYPLNRADLIRALALWPELEPLAKALIAEYPVFVGRGFHRLIFAGGRVSLTLIIDDAAHGLDQLLLAPNRSTTTRQPIFREQNSTDFNSLARHGHSLAIDAWFLDGFSPAKNPQMWSAELFTAIGQLSRAGTTAATFSAAGIVKQGLRSAGFTVRKVAGFGRKREMVTAVVDDPESTTGEIINTATGPQTNSDDHTKTTSGLRYPHFPTPWMLVRNWQQPASRTAVVIGGGLAGCHTARALAIRGWHVTLLERNQQLADEGSGNPQGILYAKLSPKQESLAAFNLASLQFALRHYLPFWADSGVGDRCGVIQLAHTLAEQQLHKRLQENYGDADALVKFVTAGQASELAGIALDHGGLFFPDAGWLNPAALCQALVTHPNINIRYNSDALTLVQNGSIWEIRNQHGVLAEAAVAVVANAADALQFTQTRHLPLKAIRGQVTYLPATAASCQLKTVVCSEGYIAPATHLHGQHLHCVGATFNLKEKDTALRACDHQTNINNLHAQVPSIAMDWTDLDTQTLAGRVAFRCATPDYLPAIGPAPQIDAFRNDYAALRKDARAFIPLAGAYWQGLYINIGHGSRGLAYTPLCGELVAAQICNEPLPLGRDLVQALHSARFVIRDLHRNR
jgi:tRNA 5-methylaminomethyl-2-thiouridine biosynthesis bifunctional protein